MPRSNRTMNQHFRPRDMAVLCCGFCWANGSIHRQTPCLMVYGLEEEHLGQNRLSTQAYILTSVNLSPFNCSGRKLKACVPIGVKVGTLVVLRITLLCETISSSTY